MHFKGIRYALDLTDRMEYAIIFPGSGSMPEIRGFNDDGDSASLKPNSDYFAIDDSTASIDGENTTRVITNISKGVVQMQTSLYQITTDDAGEISQFIQSPVTYELRITENEGKILLHWRITDSSWAHLMEQGISVNLKRTYRLGPMDKEELTALVKDDSVLFPPHHSHHNALYARHEVTVDALLAQEANEQTASNTEHDGESQSRAMIAFNQNSDAILKGPSDDVLETLLMRFGRDLTHEAQQGLSTPILAREQETDLALASLLRKNKGSLCFVGRAGVGKTALFDAVAQRLIGGDVPERLQNARVVLLDLAAMAAGTKYRGEFEIRIKPLLDGLAARGGMLNGKRILLAIDELHSTLDAGSAMGASSARELLKPYLARGGVNIMGATTEAEYDRHIGNDPALTRRFEKVVINEPQPDRLYEIVQGVWPYYRQHHNLNQDITQADIEFTISATSRLMPDFSHPDKALDTLDEAAARAVMHGRRHITREDLVQVIANKAKVSPDFLQKDDHQRYIELEQNLNQDVFGQPAAAAVIGKRMKMVRAGLSDPNKPLGAFVFQGVTGVGKTEICKSLARHLFGSEKALIKFDMGEFGEKHSLSRLIGTAPGYVGFNDTPGLLTDAIRKHPHAVVLLDEIEKAHPDIYNILLAPMNDGEMIDNKGRLVSFRNVMFVMTTNAGAGQKQKSIGFHDKGEESHIADPEHYEQAMRTVFRPEMIGRIKALGGFVAFNGLSEGPLRSILQRELENIGKNLADNPIGLQLKNLSVRLEGNAESALLAAGFKPDQGARAMQGAVSEFVAQPLSDWLLTQNKTIAAFLQENQAGEIIIDDLLDFRPRLVKAKAPQPANDTPAQKQLVTAHKRLARS